jgi:uncharacterized membrane protein (DUF485 family)
MDDRTAARIRANPKFQLLERTRRGFGWTLTIVMLAIYYGFIALVAFFPSMIGQSVGGSITLGLVLGIAVILSAIVLTGVYVWRANGEFDELTREVVAENVRELELAR